MRSFVLALSLIASLTVSALAKPAPHLAIVTPAYTLDCGVAKAAHGRITLACVSHATTRRSAHSAFENFRFGDSLPYAILAQVAPCGNGSCPANADGTTLTQSGATLSVNLANANTWTATQSSTANVGFSAQNGTNAACPGAGTPAGTTASQFGEFGAICIGPGAPATAIVIGKTCASAAWGTNNGACNSGSITWCAGTASTTERCSSFYQSAGSLIEAGTNATGLTLNGTLDLAVDPISRATKIGAGAVCTIAGTTLTSPTGNNFACRGPITAGTSVVITFGTAYTTNPPVCSASDETTAVALKVVPTTTTVTVSGATSGDTIDVVCIGNGTL